MAERVSGAVVGEGGGCVSANLLLTGGVGFVLELGETLCQVAVLLVTGVGTDIEDRLKGHSVDEVEASLFLGVEHVGIIYAIVFVERGAIALQPLALPLRAAGSVGVVVNSSAVDCA